MLGKMLRRSVGNTEDFKNMEEMKEKSIRPIDGCKELDEKNADLLRTNTATGIPQAPADQQYIDYVGEVYTYKQPNEALERGKYCIKKPKLLFDGIWSPYIFAKDGFMKVKWELTDGNLFEGDVCMDSLYDTLKPMPKILPPDCPIKCINDCDDPIELGKEGFCGNKCDLSYYCNGPNFTDPQNISDPIDPQDKEVVCFPSIFNQNLKNRKPTSVYGF